MLPNRFVKIPYESFSQAELHSLNQQEIIQDEWEQKVSAEEQQSIIQHASAVANGLSASSSSSSSASSSQSMQPTREAIDELPHELKQITLDYLYPFQEDYDSVSETAQLLAELPIIHANEEEDNVSIRDNLKSLYRKQFTFFENVSAITLTEAKQAAFHVVMDEPDKVEQLIKENESIRYCVVEIADEDGNRLKGNLLQLAAMTGNFNPRELKVPEAHYGLFEKLSYYYSPEEVAEAAKVVNSPGWKANTARRMQPYVDAFDELMKSFIDASTNSMRVDALKERYKSAIEIFKNKLKPNPNEVITFGDGYVFDLSVIAVAFDKAIAKNFAALGGRGASKIDVMCVVGAGYFQKKASACDARIIKRGVMPVFEGGALPDRVAKISYKVVKSSDGSRSFSLGSDFVWDIYGCGWAGWVAYVGAWSFKKLMSNKNISVQQIYAATRQTIESAVHDNVNRANNS